MWPTAQGLVVNTLEYLWEYVPARDLTAAPEDKDFATPPTQQDNVVRAHQLGTWMSFYLTVAWEKSGDDVTQMIFQSFAKVRTGPRARCSHKASARVSVMAPAVSDAARALPHPPKIIPRRRGRRWWWPARTGCCRGWRLQRHGRQSRRPCT